ncbi:MAG: hypothetical protein NTY19_37750 [Planctomycetota bacterium]|nr:hypothetical protein [Planctomycetota bacterium]
MPTSMNVCLLGLCLLACAALPAQERVRTGEQFHVAVPGCDPLVVSAASAVPPSDLTVRDPARSRDIPLRVYLPAAKDPAPVVLFSHGLGGSREGCGYLGHHWSARGYVVVFLQHPGSDNSV